MPIIDTPDGHYTHAVTTEGEGDGNDVVYDNWRVPGKKTPVWDKWSYEASLGSTPGPITPSPAPPGTDGLTPVPTPIPDSNPQPVPADWMRKPIPITTPADGEFAPRMMSDRANAWIQDGTAYVFAGSRNSGGPQFFGVSLASGHVTSLGARVPYVGETEFWYWMPDGTVMIAEGPRLHRVDPFSGRDDVVMDASGIPGTHMIDQWHSSDDGGTHSATLKNADYQKFGTVTLRRGKLDPWPAMGVLDESQVSRDGRFVIIKENRGTGDDNRIINLDSRVTKWLRDQERGIGHSDCGPDYVVGEADKPDPGACVLWQLDRLNESPRILFLTTNMGYVSTRGGRCLHSSDTHLSLVALDGSGVMPLIEHGAHAGNDYDLRVKANLDPSGRVATYMVGGQVYLLVLPA